MEEFVLPAKPKTKKRSTDRRFTTTASHLTFAQAARYLGITWAAVQERVKRGSLTMIEEQGVKMIPKTDLAREKKADAPRREQAQEWSRDNPR